MGSEGKIHSTFKLTKYFLKAYYYTFRLIKFFIISIKVLLYGIIHPSVIFNFLFGVVTEIAEFHKRCGGRVKNFNESKLYREITNAIQFSKSNSFNVDFGTIRPIEAQVLAALVAHVNPKTVFEFGTYTGFSTMHLGKNLPTDAVIYTLDLPQNMSEIVLKNDLHEAHRDIKNINLNGSSPFPVGKSQGLIFDK